MTTFHVLGVAGYVTIGVVTAAVINSVNNPSGKVESGSLLFGLFWPGAWLLTFFLGLWSLCSRAGATIDRWHNERKAPPSHVDEAGNPRKITVRSLAHNGAPIEINVADFDPRHHFTVERCWKCQAPVREGARHCPACGHARV